MDKFKYLDSEPKEEGGCEAVVQCRVKTAWTRWNNVTSVICDRRIPSKWKVIIHKMVIRPVIMYGAETWALRKREEEFRKRTEVRMLRWVSRVSRKEWLMNEEICKGAGVAWITEMISPGYSGLDM